MDIIEHTQRNSNAMQCTLNIYKWAQIDIYVLPIKKIDIYMCSCNKYVCKNRSWGFIRIHGALIALELWFKTIFNALNNHLRKIPSTCHFNSFLSVESHTIIP
uniref:Uncharacterized protein n=1 Tax=Opuntia streptacantha TaxID=393608 RepID=A0A7C8Z5C9_OPUST